MPRTPDRFPGEREEDVGVILKGQADEPAEIGEIRNVNGEIHAKDSGGIFDLRTGGDPPFPVERLLLTTNGGIIYSTTGALVVKAVA